MSQPTGRKQDTILALRHSYPAGSTILVTSYHLALRRNHQVESKVLVLLYVKTNRSEAGYYTGFTSQLSIRKLDASHITSSCFTSQPSSQKQEMSHHNNYSPFRGRSFRTIPSLSRNCSNFTRDRGLVNTSATCSFTLMYWSFKAPLSTMSRM
jgi:hypothetical protein